MEAKTSMFWNFIKHMAPAAVFEIGSDLLKGSVKEHGPKLIKSFIGGLGTNDEALFQSACSYAVLKHGVTSAEIVKIVTAINNHPEARARIVEIIGKDEQPTTLDISTEDKKGKTVTTKNIVNMNVMGGQTIFVMSKMSEAEIVTFLQASGGFDTVGQNLKDFVKNPSVQNIVNQLKTNHKSVDDWFVNHHYKGV